ncbi:MAG: DMT family transporter [Phascolarctobacterium sp.]|nr:DMT family transporter [Phascolarctobacterium sp.]
MNLELTVKQSTIFLAILIVARSTSFLFSKLLITSMDIHSILSFRFLLAFLILLIIFRKELPALSKKIIFYGMVIGTFFSATMVSELICLQKCSTGTAAFLENSAVVIVPLLNACIMKKFPERKIIISSCIALVGLALLTLFNTAQSFNYYLLFGLASAIFYSLAILCMGFFSQKENPLLIGIIQVGAIGLYSLIIALVNGNLQWVTSSTNYLYLLYLTIIPSTIGFTFQPLCQKKVPSNIAGLFCALSPCSCTILGFLFLGETLTPIAALGCILILSGIIIPNMKK